MKKESVFVVDIFKEITNDISTKLGYTVNYQYGSIKEIIENLKELTTIGISTGKKYPVIALLTDFKQKKGTQTDIYAEVSLNILIFNVTKSEFKASQRTINSFKAILYPIYEQLIDSLKSIGYFKIQYNDEIPHEHTDRYYWGRTQIGFDDTKLSDYIDAIEIENLELKVNNKKC